MEMLKWFLPEVGKWILWVGGGIMVIVGIFGLNLPVILIGVLIAVFGSIIAILLNVHEQNEELEKRLDFMIEKNGWKEEFEESNDDDLTPKQREILRREREAQAKKAQEEKAILDAVRQKHPEELTPEQLGVLIEEERRARDSTNN